MRKQTKLVAVLSTAALLAIGASMTSFAATGWAEEDGTWVYYNRDGERATEQWKKSGNNWYWLDSDGEMAVDQLIEDGDNYYYVDINGVMASNQWVAIDNEDAGEDDEPDHYWYYFQANGKALKNGDNSKVALKTINGKKYAFDEEGKMLWGWVNATDPTHIDDTDGNAFEDGVYYFGGPDDGAMTTGWLQLDITYSDAESNSNYDYIGAAFTDDEDQTRWFYFKSNGKKVAADPSDDGETKDKTINGKKYAFDKHGAMVAEWSLNDKDLSKVQGYGDNYQASPNEAGHDTWVASGNQVASQPASASQALDGAGNDALYTRVWKYFSNVEDGARVSKGWFKVVSAEMINSEKYDDDEEAWYYADGSGNLYAGEFKTIKGKKYAFRNDGRMVSGLKFILKNNDDLLVKADDDGSYPFDNEDDFLANAANYYERNGYKCYYFGDGEDGAMRTGKTSVTIDGESQNFYFQKSGGNKGAGLTGEKDDKLYQSGMLLKAGSDEKYQVVKKTTVNGVETYVKLDDAEAFMADVKDECGSSAVSGNLVNAASTEDSPVAIGNNSTKKAKDLTESYSVNTTNSNGVEYILVNTSGKVVDKKGKSKDGNDYNYVTNASGKIVHLYVED